MQRWEEEEPPNVQAKQSRQTCCWGQEDSLLQTWYCCPPRDPSVPEVNHPPPPKTFISTPAQGRYHKYGCAAPKDGNYKNDRPFSGEGRYFEYLQTAFEAIITKSLEDVNMCAIHVRRVTVQPKNVELSLRLTQEPSLYDCSAYK